MERRSSARRRRVSPEGDQISSLITEAHQAPLDEASFMRYYHVAMKAASMEGPSPSVKDRLMRSLNSTQGGVLDVVFGDDPLSRMAIADEKQAVRRRTDRQAPCGILENSSPDPADRGRFP